MAKGAKTTAKVKGAARGAVKTLSGYPGIFRRLAAEHGEVSALMERIAASPEDAAVREELFPELRRSLLAHAKAEEEEFYPRLRDAAGTKEMVSLAREEHRKIERCLEELASAESAGTWRETFERMMRAVESHVDMEENRLFPAADQVLSNEEARALEERYAAAEEREKAKPL